MLVSHMNAVEERLLVTSKIPAGAGHPLHKGTPREAFIKEFLNSHLSERVAIGTGEIIDCESKPDEPRNQHDIVIYKRDYPKLDFGGGVSGFLAESVVATIEVKSELTKDELQKATVAAHNTKALKRNIITAFHAGYQPPSILSYVVAYRGPASMKTVHGWLPDICEATNVAYPELPAKDEARDQIVSPAIDAVFVLGAGLIHFGNSFVGFITQGTLERHPDVKWALADCERGSLLMLFLMLTQAVSGSSASWLRPGPYVARFRFPQPALFGT